MVATSDTRSGVSAAILYAIAYTLELVLSSTAYFGSARGRAARRRTLVAHAARRAGCRRRRSPKGEFHPEEEFELQPWISIELGPLDLSINKAVVYLLLGALCTFLLGFFLMRFRLSTDPDRRQTIGEWVYEIAQEQVAEQGLPTKAIKRWFPYVASLMLFIWVVNMLGFIPLPLDKVEIAGTACRLGHLRGHVADLGDAGARAADASSSPTSKASAHNGPVRYFKSWIPEVPKPMFLLIVPLEILGQFMRLISLSVRLFANMLAGHMLILTFIGLIFVLESTS